MGKVEDHGATGWSTKTFCAQTIVLPPFLLWSSSDRRATLKVGRGGGGGEVTSDSK